jgi:hypothetical protein
VAQNDRKTFRRAGRRFDGESLDKFAFREPPSDLFIDFAGQSTDVLAGLGSRRRVRCVHLKENKPFAVQ